MIIGLTGTLASGKGVVSDFFKKKGFLYFSLSDELREILRENNVSITRENLQEWGNKMREENGPDYLARRVRERILLFGCTNAIIDGIRNPAEAKFLKKIRNFFLVAVDAPKKIRFERMKSRNRESDPATLKDFLKVDAKDRGVGEKSTGQGVGKCISLAQFVLVNDGSFEEASSKVDALYSDIMKSLQPPSWDEYFMSFAKTAATKSKDPSTKVGACIVDKDRRIVGLGYNGFPKKIDDNSLPMEREGSFLETKYAYVVHAEPNAILNATKSTNDCRIYVTLFPCNECAKLIIQAGITEVVYLDDKYAGTEVVQASKRLFKAAKVKMRQLVLY